MNTSVKRVKSKKMLKTAVEDATVEGWKIQSEGDSVAVLKKQGGVGGALGHILVLVFTGWWTFGIGNLIFAGYRYVSGAQELIIKIEAK